MKLPALVLLVLVTACLLAPLYARAVGTDPFRTDPLGTIDIAGQQVPVLAEAPNGLGTEPIGPGWHAAYLLGADSLGRDLMARLLYGGRTSLLVATGATLLCLLVGGTAGILAGAAGGLVDGAISGLVDLLWAFPVTLLAISLALVLVGAPLVLGPPAFRIVLRDDSLVLPILILGVVFAPYVARPVRAALLALRETPFVEAARATGGSPLWVLRRHMLPQLLPLLAGLAPIVAAMALLTEAALSVLGLGVQAPAASWGTLIADGQALLHQRPLAAIAPGAAVAATVVALNALGEALGA